MRTRKGKWKNDAKVGDGMQIGDGRSDWCPQTPQAKEARQRREFKSLGTRGQK
jgi:hypothetical protein